MTIYQLYENRSNSTIHTICFMKNESVLYKLYNLLLKCIVNKTTKKQKQNKKLCMC